MHGSSALSRTNHIDRRRERRKLSCRRLRAQEMEVVRGHAIAKPQRFIKRCRTCGSFVMLNWHQMNFSGPTFARCACRRVVQFTGDFGMILSDVICDYEKESQDG